MAPLHAFRCDICQAVEYRDDDRPQTCLECDLLMREIALDEAAGPSRPGDE